MVLQIDPNLLLDHPDNANRMDPSKFDKLVANVERTGMMPAIVVRDLGDGRFQILDGHHRRKVAVRLGWPQVPIDNWGPMGEEDAAVLLLTFNRLRGKPVKPKLKTLMDLAVGGFGIDATAELIPETKAQVTEYVEWDPSGSSASTDEREASDAVPHVTLVRGEWVRVIEAAVSLRASRGDLPPIPPRLTHGPITDDLRAGAALYLICADYVLRNTPHA